jgi:hypothetical protein
MAPCRTTVACSFVISAHILSQGVVIDKKGNIVFADGRRIRRVIVKTGIIETIAGLYHINEWKPMDACQTELVNSPLQWPTDLAINPWDQSLYFLDGDEILQLRKDKLLSHKFCHQQ